MIKIAEGQHGAIIANIPLDQQGLKISDIEALRKHFWLGIKRNLAIIGPLLALVCWLIAPNWLTGLLLSLHLILYVLFRRLAEAPKPKSWGVVYDKNVKKPLSQAVARIYSPEYDRMLDVYVTDNYGRYGFLAGHNIYYLTADKDGYRQSRTDNLDLRSQEAEDIINQDLLLAPESGEQPFNKEQPQPPTQEINQTAGIADHGAAINNGSDGEAASASDGLTAFQTPPLKVAKPDPQTIKSYKNKEDIFG